VFKKFVSASVVEEHVLGPFHSTGGLVISTGVTQKEETLDSRQELWPNSPSLILVNLASGTWISLISVSFLPDVLALSQVTTVVGVTGVQTDTT